MSVHIGTEFSKQKVTKATKVRNRKICVYGSDMLIGPACLIDVLARK